MELDDRVVVTGMGALCSIGADVPSFTAALRAGHVGRACDLGLGYPLHLIAGRDALPELLRRAARRATFRSPLPVQAAVATALEAWDQAGLHRATAPAERLGLVVAGSNLNGRYLEELNPKLARSPAHVPASLALHSLDTDHVGTLSELLGIRGEGCTMGGASASGNLAIVHGTRLVGSGEVDACLVVGAMTDLSALEEHGLRNLGAMAEPPAGAPFDEAHRGFVYGRGAACLVLESERSARARGATVLAALQGYGVALDGNRLADPSEAGEVGVMAAAIRRGGLEAGAVTYVNAHGTASRLGDEVEARAIRRVFTASPRQPWVNATKGLTGHCLCAAGVIEAVATIVQMRDGFLHPNPGLERPIDDRCRFVGPAAQPARIDYALSNGFGFGGFSTSILLANLS